MPAGRPTSFKSEYVKQAEMLTYLGAIDTQLAEFFNVAVSTIYEWKKNFPEFSEALKAGKEMADERVKASLYRKACGSTITETKTKKIDGKEVVEKIVKEVMPDSTACLFWLKNRDPENWRDKVEHQHTGKDGEQLLSENPVEFARKVAYLLTVGSMEEITH